MTAKTPVDARPLRRADLWQRQAAQENALYDPQNNSVHILNETAWAIWGLCDGGTSPEEMIEAICELSRMPRDIVSEDVERVLAQFDEAGLVTWVLE